MESRLETVQFCDFLAEHSREGRDVQLYEAAGQVTFVMFDPPTGGIRSSVAVFPILRGEGERAPKFEGSFPTEDGEIADLGRGWIVMCVLFHDDQTLMGKMTKLERAEDKLRAMKSGSQGGN